MRKQSKILFVHESNSSFIEQDLKILQKHFNTKNIKVGTKKTNYREKLLISIKILKKILQVDLTFSWFAGNHAYLTVILSKIFRKKSVVIIGGFEVAREPEINYGALFDPTKFRRIKYVLENADKVIAVSKFNKEEILKISRPKSLEILYNSVDTNKFKSEGTKENLVITVGTIVKEDVIRKGIETFVKSAILMPDTVFVVVGKWVDESIKELKSLAPKNVKFTGFVSDEELLKWYQKSKVYCQLSYHESFGVALAEAMTCECVPVITDRGAMFEVAGDTGFIVPYGDHEATAKAIKKALSSENGSAARQRVLELFNTEERERKLVEVVRNL